MRYIQWLDKDLWVVARTVGGLLAFISGGILLAEGAMLDLTRYTQHVEFLNLQVTERGVYTFYFLGESISVQSLVSIGKITATARKVFVEIGGADFVLNTLPGFDAHNIYALLGTWVMVAKQGVSVLLYDAGNGLVKAYLWVADYLHCFF